MIRCVRMRHAWDARGSGSMLVVGVIAVGLFLAAALGLGVGYVHASHRAAAAADLAALSAATAHQTGRDACAAARVVAEQNGAQVVGCRVSGTRFFVVAVEVSVPIRPALPGLSDHVVALAYAGSASLADGG